MTRVLSIDFETASTVDLRKTGVDKYARHATTRVLCMAYRFDKRPVQVWREGQPFPAEVLDHVARGFVVRAWNAKFEKAIWNYTLARQIGPGAHQDLRVSQLRDTMAQGVYWGTPLSLGEAAKALKIPVQKDGAGHSLMMQMCRPRKFTDQGIPIWWHLTDPAKFDRLVDYCRQDVEVESYIADLLPPLPDREQKIWELDCRTNDRGVCVDLELADKLEAVATQAKALLDQKMKTLAGCSTNQSAAILAKLQSLCLPIPDIRRATLELVRAGRVVRDGPQIVRDIIDTRLDAARTSTAKLAAFKNAATPLTSGPGCRVGVIRGALQHYGAGRTGRWAGRLIQPQNIPRPPKSLGDKLDMLVGAVRAHPDAPMLEALFPESAMTQVSSLLRSCIVAAPGQSLCVADFSQIEARVVAWLAGQQDLLDVFARGEDVYVYTAAKIGSTNRQLGKTIALGLGFGMGGDKFQDTAGKNGIALSNAESHAIVKAWRDANPRIVKFWWDVDRAARQVAEDPRAVVQVGTCIFRRKGKAMFIRLPSGRELVYREIHLDQEGSLTFMGVNQLTKKWSPIRTYGGKLVENIVQATARDAMAEAMLAFDDYGLRVVLTVHDEVLVEDDDQDAHDTLKAMLDIMSAPPSWAPGLPTKAEGYVSKRYRK